ncbi:MAG: RNA polymerase sigma factor [Bacteroidota bacterium]
MAARVIPISDQHIAEGCCQNDRNSQRLLYERYFESLSLVCYRYIKDRSLVDDMVHEGFMKIFRNIQKYNGKGSLEGWMKRVMVNHCLDYLRKQGRQPHQVDLESGAGHRLSDEDIVSNLQANYILELIHQLPELYRTVFNLNVIEGYPHKEIAKMLKVKESTSRAYLTEAKKMIRKKLQQVESGAERWVQNG